MENEGEKKDGINTDLGFSEKKVDINMEKGNKSNAVIKSTKVFDPLKKPTTVFQAQKAGKK